LGDPAAGEIEQRVFAKQMSDVTAARQSHLYDQALAQLYQAASNFPDHTELRSMQDDVHQEQQRYNQQQEEQRRQAELAAQTKKYPAQHRHGTGESFCTGVITITRMASATTTATRPTARDAANMSHLRPTR
jgi:hypothetical protein